MDNEQKFSSGDDGMYKVFKDMPAGQATYVGRY